MIVRAQQKRSNVKLGLFFSQALEACGQCLNKILVRHKSKNNKNCHYLFSVNSIVSVPMSRDVEKSMQFRFSEEIFGVIHLPRFQSRESLERQVGIV